MKRYFIFCLALILIACAAPATEALPTVEPTKASATPTAIPNTPEVQTFLKVFGEEPIVPKGSYGTWDDRFTDPGAVVYYEGAFHMFRNGFRGFPAASQVGYVTSTDGYRWTKIGDEPVFKTSDVPFAKIAMYASSALVSANREWIIYFYTWDSSNIPYASVIGRATAPQATGPWVSDAEPVLKPGSTGEWDEQQVLAPHVIQTDDGYIMYYSGADSTGKQQIGMATSSDGIQWTKYNDPATTDAPYAESDPVFQPGEAGSWDAYQVHQPRVLETPQGWAMFYRGTKDRNNNMALGLATSDDGIHWDRSALNPVFDPHDIPRASYFWFHNAVFVNDTYFIFIESDISQTTEIYLATHEGGIPK
ncbi:MAG: hypothetical protein JNM55_17815 [Anaerolineales bacterium]|nr:hypothetical protein [Anaerolineales bacterium]